MKKTLVMLEKKGIMTYLEIILEKLFYRQLNKDGSLSSVREACRTYGREISPGEFWTNPINVFDIIKSHSYADVKSGYYIYSVECD